MESVRCRGRREVLEPLALGGRAVAVDAGLGVAYLHVGHKSVPFHRPPRRKHDGKLDHSKATPEEIRGEAVYSDNLSHDLKVERFYDKTGSTSMGKPGRAEGLIKTFPLRGIKDSSPYLHDGGLLTLEDTVEFFNIVLESKMTASEKADLVAFLRTL